MKIIKRIMFAVIAVMCLTMFSVPAFAAPVEQDGISAVIETEKESYEKGETVTGFITIKNNNSYDVTNIVVESILPENYELISESSYKIDKLAAGEDTKVAIQCKQKNVSTSTAVEIEDEKIANAKDPDNTLDSKVTASAETTASATAASATAASKFNTKVTTDKSVKTADDTNIVFLIVILVIAAIGITVLVINKKKITNKMITLFLAMVLCITSINYDFANAEDNKFLFIEKNVTVGDDTLSIKAKISYDDVKDVEESEPKEDEEDSVFTPTTYAPVTSLDEDDADIEIYSFNADTYKIITGQETEVLFTAQIFANIVMDDKNVYVKDEDGNEIGLMNDKGVDGDVTSDDGIFTLKVTLSHSEDDNISYYAIVDEIVSDGFNIGYYTRATQEQRQEVADVDNVVKTLTQSDEFGSATLAERKEMAQELLNNLANQGSIKAGSILYNEEQGVFSFKYNTGVLGGIMISDFSETTNSSNTQTNATGSYTSSAAVYNSYVNDEISTHKAIIYNAFEDSPYRRDFYNNLDSEWDGVGLTTDVDLEVTVDDFKNISASDYDIVVFAMHGSKIAVDDEDMLQSVLCLNEEATTDKDSEYEFELTNNYISRVALTSGDFYWVLPEFFTNCVSANGFDGKFFFSESCMFYGCDCQSTDPNYALADAITGRSAEAVVGYHNSVGADYSRNVMKWTIEKSFNGMTIEDALDSAKDKYGDDDDYEDEDNDKYIAYPIIRGDESYVIRAGGTISGSVIDAASSTPIPLALVRVYKKGGLGIIPSKIGVTDLRGEYKIPSVVPGTYIVKIDAGSYRSMRYEITVEAERVTYTATAMMTKTSLINSKIIKGFVTNAVTSEKINGVTLNVRKNWNNKTGAVLYTTTTNSNGYYEINYKSGVYTVEIIKEGFITEYSNVLIGFGFTKDFTISPEAIDGVYRIVLTWGQKPSDLDSHMVGKYDSGSTFHVYFGDRDAYYNGKTVCSLDVDDVTSYGPETITLNTTNTNPYYYYVYNYSGTGSFATSNAQINVYKGQTLINTFYAPTNQGDARFWNVFAIKGSDIIVNNTISSISNMSYAN